MSGPTFKELTVQWGDDTDKGAGSSPTEAKPQHEEGLEMAKEARHRTQPRGGGGSRSKAIKGALGDADQPEVRSSNPASDIPGWVTLGQPFHLRLLCLGSSDNTLNERGCRVPGPG